MQFGRSTKEVHKIQFVADFEDVFLDLTQPTLYFHKEKKPKIIVSIFQYQVVSK